MSPFIIEYGSLAFLFAWLVGMWHVCERRERIVGCTHDRGREIEGVPDIRGRMTAMVWQCDDCPFQHIIRVDRSFTGRLGDGETLWVHRRA